MVMTKSKWLKFCVAAALMAGGTCLSGVTVGAQTFDMTSDAYKDGITYKDPDKDVGSSSDPCYYVYKYDAANKQVIGGTVTVASNNYKQSAWSTGVYFFPVLRISSSDLGSLNASDVKTAMNELAKKLVLNVEGSSAWMATGNVQIQVVDDVNAANPKVLRSFAVQYKARTGTIDNIDGLKQGLYTSTIRNNGKEGEYELGGDGTWKHYGANVTLNVDTSKKTDDNVYSAMSTDEGKNVGSTNVSGNSVYMDTTAVTVDASRQAGSKAYGIYDNTGSTATWESNNSTFTITGDEAAGGVLAENLADDKASTVYVNTYNSGSGISFNLNGKKTVGMEAGKNGAITARTDSSWKGNITISSPNGYALYAHDGGKITLPKVSVSANGGTGLYAEKGGQITVNDLSGNIGIIKTDDDKDSLITAVLTGDASTSLEGNVNATVKGTMTGDNASSGTLTVNGTWTGSMKNENGSVTLGEGDVWNVGSDTVGHMAKLTGSDSNIRRGYINMGSKDLTIDKYSGNATFVYGHDESSPENLTGGKVIIKSAEPLTIYSEGIGDSGSTQTVSSTIDSTITVATSAAGITDTDTAKKVLDALAAKAYYQAYTTGERNLTGTAEIQEGLTTSSITKYLGNLSWSDTDGQGRIDSVKAPYNQIITGDPSKDTAYADVYDQEKHVFNFNKDTDITIKVSEDPRGRFYRSGQFYLGALTNWGDQWLIPTWSGGKMGNKYSDGPSFTVDMHGHDLSIDMEAFPPAGTTGSQPYWSSYAILVAREGTVSIDNPGKITLNANANYYYGGCIRVSGNEDTENGNHLIINNDNTPEHAVVMRGGIATPAYELDYWTISNYGWKTADKFTPEQIYRYDNTVDIKGLVDIETLTGAPAIVGKSGHISVGGGRIVAKNYPAIMTRSDTTTINLNVLADEDGHIQGPGSNELVLKGNAVTGTPFWGAGGTINMAFVTDKSEFDGQFYGHTGGVDGAQNLWLANGAVWNNGPQLMHVWSSQKDNATDNASIVTNFHGGSSLDKAGNIFQTSAKDITLENMDGFVNVYMKHGDSSPSDFSSLGNIIVEKASKTDGVNSHVRMITSGVTAADMAKEDTVKEVLNALAGKLYYTACVNGEENLDATAEIAEGLTTSSFTYRLGNVSFKKDNGQGEITGDITKQYPEGQQLADQTEAITGSDASEEYYKEQGILNKDGIYDFSLDPSSVTVSKATASIDGSDAAAAVAASDKDITIKADNTTAAFSATGSDSLKAAGMYSTNGKTINANGGTIRVSGDGRDDADALLADNGTININTDGNGKTDIKGNMTAKNGGAVNIGAASGSTLAGNTTGDGTVTMKLADGATWTGASQNENTKVDLGGSWVQTGDSTVASITGNGGTLDKSSADSGTTNIGNLTGKMNVLYSHDAYEPSTVNGGDTIIGTAGSGSQVNLITDNSGLNMASTSSSDRQKVDDTFSALANKLVYKANDGNLTGKLEIAEGLTGSSAALDVEDITFDKEGRGQFTGTTQPVIGPKETQIMKGTKTALLGAATLWRNNNNDLQRRLGDLRLGRGENGVWAKYIGGSSRMDSQNTEFSQSYDIGQAGYDRKAGSWIVGAAVDYGKGKSSYSNGRGNERLTEFALYGSHVSDNGQYLDIIAKTGRVKSDFHADNRYGNRLDGDYHSWGNSLSVEYGKRFVHDTGFYLDPSVEFTMGRLNGKTFTGTSDIGNMYIRQHAFNSAIGRIGLGIGRQLPKSNVFAKFALAHEFGGDFKTDYWEDGGTQKSTKVDLSDTWVDMELGGSVSLGKNTYLYGTYTHSFGADLTTRWRADVGVRYTF